MAPWDVAADSHGNIYIADGGNNDVRKVDQSTRIISTIAGNQTAGFSGDNGPATSAQLKGPTALAIDRAGNIYIADSQNDRIRPGAFMWELPFAYAERSGLQRPRHVC